MGVRLRFNFPRSCQVARQQKNEYLNNNKYPAMQFLARPFFNAAWLQGILNSMLQYTF